MPRKISAEGRTITVPDDATDEEINQIFGSAPSQGPKNYGNLDTIPSSDSEPGVIGQLKTGVHNFGARVANNGLGLLKPLLHPQDTGNEILQRGAFPITPEGIKNASYSPGGVDKGSTAANLLGDIATAGIIHQGTTGLPKLGTALRSGAAVVDNAAIGTDTDALSHGGNPGRALSTNRITGMNPTDLIGKVKSLIPAAADEHRGIVASNPGNAMINAGPLVSEPFDSQIADKTNPRTGVASPAQVARAGNTRNLLTHVMDDTSGKPTPNMRDPHLTPLEATELKSNIYQMTDYDNPSQSAISNEGLKGAAAGLRTAVGDAVPESIPSGQRLHDLMTAKDVLAPRSKFGKIPTSKSGVLDHAITQGLTTGAAGLDLTGSGLEGLGRYLNAPSIIPVAAALGLGKKIQ